MNSIETGKKVLRIESKAIEDLIGRIDKNFDDAVNILYHSKGRIIVTGMGKSGLIGKKMSATFASTGAPSFFLHPAEGIHGDIGMIMKDDTILVISNSGETGEIIALLPTFKRMNLKVICLTGRTSSTIAKNSDIVLDVSVKEEACPMNLVPTASTTVSLALGDALAVALFDKRKFRKEDFALFHPGGSIGKKLLLTVGDLMHTGPDVPAVDEDCSMKDIICVMTSKKLGVAIITDDKKKLTGIITDGDLRRIIEREQDIFKLRASDVMSRSPKVISKDALAVSAVQMMEEYSITSLVIVNNDNTVTGIVHLHDLLRNGIV